MWARGFFPGPLHHTGGGPCPELRGGSGVDPPTGARGPGAGPPRRRGRRDPGGASGHGMERKLGEDTGRRPLRREAAGRGGPPPLHADRVRPIPPGRPGPPLGLLPRGGHPTGGTYGEEGGGVGGAAIRCIEAEGVEEPFLGTWRKYLHVGDRKYWHMGKRARGG